MPLFGGLMTPGISPGPSSGQYTSGVIGDAAVNSGNLGSGQVAWPHLSSGAVRSGHLADTSVNSGNLSSGVVSSPHHASGAARSGHLADNAVNSGNLSSGSVSWPHLSSGAVRSGGLADNSVNSGNLSSGVVSWVHLSSGAVRSGHLADTSVNSGTVSSGVVSKLHTASGLLQGALQFVIDGGGTALASGEKGDVIVPFDCKLNYVNIFSDQSGGSVFLGVWRDTFANYPPTSGDTISPSGVPLISGAITKSYSGTAALSGWVTSFNKGDVIKFAVHSGLTMTRVTIAMQVGVGD